MNRSRRLWSWVIAFAIVALLMVCALWLDPFAQAWIAEHQNRALESFMKNVSRFGDWPEHDALGLGLAAVAWLCRSKKWTRIFLAMLLACVLAGAASRVVKITTGRARPNVKAEQAWTGPRFSSKYNAFPSGHTTASTAFFAALFFASPRIGLVFLPIPILIGFSRIYVGAHYLSDVVFAAILGVVCAAIVWRFFGQPRASAAGSDH